MQARKSGLKKNVISWTSVRVIRWREIFLSKYYEFVKLQLSYIQLTPKNNIKLKSYIAESVVLDFKYHFITFKAMLMRT